MSTIDVYFVDALKQATRASRLTKEICNTDYMNSQALMKHLEPPPANPVAKGKIPPSKSIPVLTNSIPKKMSLSLSTSLENGIVH